MIRGIKWPNKWNILNGGVNVVVFVTIVNAVGEPAHAVAGAIIAIIANVNYGDDGGAVGSVIVSTAATVSDGNIISVLVVNQFHGRYFLYRSGRVTSHRSSFAVPP